ncbi:hypothetical protein K227x_48250 [Rubripirellula lacrimiformis]|uniref:Uncharacterized protein n=1 Tax=Rubripirellula lacrimiformis TaxID=1930273 RepID=A0A517NH09_9BACT|nr:hypothetical protein K227x_48250 [Rubripirellula lacrimiformis]
MPPTQAIASTVPRISVGGAWLRGNRFVTADPQAWIPIGASLRVAFRLQDGIQASQFGQVGAMVGQSQSKTGTAAGFQVDDV